VTAPHDSPSSAIRRGSTSFCSRRKLTPRTTAATAKKDAPKAGKQPASGKGLFSKVKTAAKGKFKAVKDAASKATSKARGAGKKKGKQ
jgi:ribonuclease R